jgi:hypothetical protein
VKKLSILIFWVIASTILAQNNCENGTMRRGYFSPVVNGFEQCSVVTQTCIGGLWSGPKLFNTCDNPTEPCGSSLHGTTEFGFISPSAPCSRSARSCFDGSWVGPELFDFCS